MGPKQWWPQAENLLALAVLHDRFGAETDKYIRALALQLRCMQTQFTDPEFGGRIAGISAAGKVDYTKVGDWKEAYHDTRCLLAAIDLLRKFESEGKPKP